MLYIGNRSNEVRNASNVILAKLMNKIDIGGLFSNVTLKYPLKDKSIAFHFDKERWPRWNPYSSI